MVRNFKKSKIDFSEYQIQELLEDADMDDNGKIDYEEFVVMMTKWQDGNGESDKINARK